MPLPTPSLATRAAVVATGTTAAALLTLLPAAPPAPAPTAVVAPWGTGPAADANGASPVPFQTARHALGTLQTPAAPTEQAPAAPATVQAPVKLVAAAQPAAPAVAAAAGRRGSAMAMAMGKLGSPYRWGAAGPGVFDCSGLVYWSYRQTGLTLPRSSRAQSQVGTAVSKGALQPGDLVFFYRPVSHVAIYIGNGRVVDASTSGKPVKISNLNDMPFTSARRI